VAIKDILGPMMIGPSSSHTLGAERIGRFVYGLMAGCPDRCSFHLHHSFCKTGKGHGTHKALVAGAIGLSESDPQIRNAFILAKARGLSWEFSEQDLGEVHPNTVRVESWKGSIFHEVVASSTGGGMIRVVRINGVDCDLSGEYPAILLINKDTRKALARILEQVGVNVANLYLRRVNKLSAKALTIIELDEEMPFSNLFALKSLDVVEEAFYVPSLVNENDLS